MVDQYSYFNNRVASRDVSNYYLVLNGEFAYNKSTSDGFPFGAVKRLDLYENGVLSTLYIVFALRETETINSDFMTVFFDTDRWYKGVSERAAEGARNHGLLNISAEDFFDIDLIIPKEEAEQEKIGQYFRNLDNLITLHQCEWFFKITVLLIFIFPKKILFITNTWEQREFSNLFVEKREKTLIEYEDILLSCAINGIFLNSELFSHFRGTSTVGYLKVKMNDLILSAQNLHLGNANVNLRFESGIISPAYKVYELNDCVPSFIQAWVKKENTKNFFLSATTEGASQCRKNIEWETLNKQLISVPKIEEQRKIGEYFSNLDNLITLHQRDFLHRKGDLLCQNNLKNQNCSVNILNAGLKCIRKELYERSP